MLLLLCAAASAGAQQQLSDAEGKLLLRISRDTLGRYLNQSEIPSLNRYSVTERLREPRGVFVTLKERRTRDLRGCIGYPLGHKALAEAVIDCTVYAATRDLRFTPLRAGQDAEMTIEVSVLSPPRRIETVDDIQVGVHGLIIEQGAKTGLLLPQVPIEQRWGREEYLRAICRKADLPDRAWEQGARLSVFTAQIFSESVADSH